jgi:hypothetical protein
MHELPRRQVRQWWVHHLCLLRRLPGTVLTVVCGVWCVVCGVWCVVCGVWCVVCGVWCVVCGECESPGAQSCWLPQRCHDAVFDPVVCVRCVCACGSLFVCVCVGLVCFRDQQAGYACAVGSATAQASTCPIGKYSVAGSASCIDCPTGTFGSSPALPSAACSGLCAAGRYGNAVAQTSNQCTGACSAGYFCVAGSTSATAAQCLAGSYSTFGLGACLPCPPGTFGSTVQRTTSGCSGPCSPGRCVSAIVRVGERLLWLVCVCGGGGGGRATLTTTLHPSSGPPV